MDRIGEVFNGGVEDLGHEDEPRAQHHREPFPLADPEDEARDRDKHGDDGVDAEIPLRPQHGDKAATGVNEALHPAITTRSTSHNSLGSI